jgi:phosphate transport system ATP-binding protein
MVTDMQSPVVETKEATADGNIKMRARGVCVYYGDKKAVDNVSLDMGTEHVTAFI